MVSHPGGGFRSVLSGFSLAVALLLAESRKWIPSLSLSEMVLNDWLNPWPTCIISPVRRSLSLFVCLSNTWLKVKSSWSAVALYFWLNRPLFPFLNPLCVQESDVNSFLVQTKIRPSKCFLKWAQIESPRLKKKKKKWNLRNGNDPLQDGLAQHNSFKIKRFSIQILNDDKWEKHNPYWDLMTCCSLVSLAWCSLNPPVVRWFFWGDSRVLQWSYQIWRNIFSQLTHTFSFGLPVIGH